MILGGPNDEVLGSRRADTERSGFASPTMSPLPKFTSPTADQIGNAAGPGPSAPRSEKLKPQGIAQPGGYLAGLRK